jgi:serine/threonine protein kinase, bacterial
MSVRPRILLGAVIAVVVVVLIAIGIIGYLVTQKNNVTSTQAASPARGIRPSAPAAVPTSSAPAVPPPDQLLDGSYRLDVDREQQTYNGKRDPQPPNVSTWWAFRSFCTSTGCAATGIILDDKDHLVARQGADNPIVLDFRDGAWQSRPETAPFACLGPNGTPGKQTTTQVLSLKPHPQGYMRGVMTVTVHTNECGQIEAQIVSPAVAERTGDVPPGVTLPSLATPGTGGPTAPDPTPGR